jgi:hypothetical protein
MRVAVTRIALVVALVVCSGCAPAISPEEQAVRTTIESYNSMLTEGYRALNMNGMTQFATPAQAESEYIHMSSLAEADIRLDPTLKKLEILKVSVEATSATAETREAWEYRHYSRKTGALVLEEKGLVYQLAWDLEKQPSGQWLVSDVRAISSTSTNEPTMPVTRTPTPPKKD